MFLWLAQSLAITVMVCVIVTNWFVVKSAEFLQGVIRKLYRLVIVAMLGVAVTVPQVYILLRPSSSRFCSQPLLNNLICNIGFTLFTTAFALLLILVDPLPSWLKSLFHTFGVASFIEAICTVLMTSLAAECAISTPALYYLSVVLSTVNVLSTVFFLIVCPFWLSNSIFPGLVLSKESKIGICYEVVTCCPCTWHI